jgi:hypothetical protein
MSYIDRIQDLSIPELTMKLRGEFGESLVAALYPCEFAYDEYDSTKDMILKYSGESVEVKTEVRFRSKNSMTVKATKTQKEKCLSVDHLWFVEYEDRDVDAKNIVTLWNCTERDKYQTTRTKDGREMLCWDINRMEVLHQWSDGKAAFILRNPIEAFKSVENSFHKQRNSFQRKRMFAGFLTDYNIV